MAHFYTFFEDVFSDTALYWPRRSRKLAAMHLAVYESSFEIGKTNLISPERIVLYLFGNSYAHQVRGCWGGRGSRVESRGETDNYFDGIHHYVSRSVRSAQKIGG